MSDDLCVHCGEDLVLHHHRNLKCRNRETIYCAMIKLPRYKCHKEVYALKIAKFERKLPTIAELESTLIGDTNEVEAVGGILTFEDSSYQPIEVSQDYVRKHQPQPGGYYVIYGDGYHSFSPAKAFEDGYTLIGEDHV